MGEWVVFGDRRLRLILTIRATGLGQQIFTTK